MAQSPYPDIKTMVAVHEDRIGRIESDITILVHKMDRLIWALVLSALTFAGAAVTLILNLSQKGG